MSTHLERLDPAEKCFRFYSLEVAPDLFGTWCLTRAWGRIGTRGRQKIDSFDGPASAARAMQRLEASKRRRGYVDPRQA